MRKLISLALVLIFATMAFAIDSRAQFRLVSGNANQTVKAGEAIEPMVFRAKYVESVTPTVLNGLELHCPDHIVMVGSEFDCILAGRVTSAAPSGKYDMVLDYFDANGDSASLIVPITVIGMNSDVELIAGKLNQTLTAGETIEPMTFKFRNMTQVFVEGVPAGVGVSIDESTYTFRISGTTRESSSNRTFNYTIKAVIGNSENSAVDTFYVRGTITLNKTPGVVSFEVIENETQSVKPGENIKPIVIQYNAGIVNFAFEAVGVPVTNFTATATANKTITLTSKVPDNYLDGSIKLRVIGIKSDGTEDTVVAVINVIGNINYPKMLVLENAEQTVAPGDSIKPVLLRYLNITQAPHAEVIKGFSAVANQANQTIKVTGMIAKNTRDTTFQMIFVAIGENGTDTARVTIHIVHKPVTTTVVFVGDDATQYVKAGDAIEPFVFRHENAMQVSAKGFPKHSSFSITTDTVTHLSYLTGTVGDSAAFGRYPLTFTAKGLDNDDTAEVMLVVMKQPVLTLISGNLNQSVTVGDSIEPLVFSYANLTRASANGLPDGVTMVSDKEAKTLTVYGKIDSSNFYGDYDFDVKAECYSLLTSVDAKITILRPQSSSSSVASSSSIASSSSVVSSSSIASSSSVVSSSSIASSSSVKSSSSIASSSSVRSSSSIASSSSVKSSSSVASSSSAKSSSSATSSSSAKSSSSAASSSSEKVKSSSSSGGTGIAAVASVPFRVSLEGRMLHIDGVEWAEVDVFDMQGRPVASFRQVKSAVSLESLRQSTYIVRVRSGSNSQIRQIMVK